MPIKAKPLHLEKPQAAMTTTPAAVAQAAPDSQLLNRHHHPYSPLQSINSCIPDLGDDCVACLDQNSVQRLGSAPRSIPTLLPAIQQPIPQEPAVVRTSPTPGMLAAVSPSVQPHQLPQTQLAQPPALNDKLSSKISEVQRQAAELDQLPNTLPHPVPQKLLKVHLVSNADDAESQALEHRGNQIQGEEQHEKQIQAQEQHEQLVHSRQASQEQTPVAELLLSPPEAKPKQPAPAAVRPACPPTKQLALPEQLPQKLQASQISKPALPLDVQPNLKQLSRHDLSNPLTNVQTRLASSALPKAAVKTGSLPHQQSQESPAPSVATCGMPLIAQGPGLASSKKHMLDCTSNKGAGSQSPPNKKRYIERDQAELTSQSDKAVNRASLRRSLRAPADQYPQSHETGEEISHLPSSSSPESVLAPSVTDTSRSSTSVSDSSISFDNTSGSMLTTSRQQLR